MRPGYPISPARLIILCLPLIIVSLASCSSEAQNSTDTTNQDPLVLNIPQVYSFVTSIEVQVAYEPGAEPYTGSIGNDTPYWWILQGNIEALFFGRDIRPSLYVPCDIEGMDLIAEQGRDSWSVPDIMALARTLWDVTMTASSAYIHVLFLNGRYDDKGTVNSQVLGLSLAGSSVITIFKDVVVEAGSSASTSKFVEQATLVHEAGHTLGLVETGVPMVSAHLDPDHPGHCTNRDCVMYWLNEGPADLREFVQQVMDTGSLVMFCDECLEDAWCYAP